MEYSFISNKDKRLANFDQPLFLLFLFGVEVSLDFKY